MTSDTAIPGLRASAVDGACDLVVSMLGDRLESRSQPQSASPWYVSPECDEGGEPLLTIWTGPDGYIVSYSEGAEFSIDPGGRRIDAQWVSQLTEADAATYLLGPVLAFVLRLRRTVPLHASAVAIDNRAVLFVGEAGAGKSTTAAAFASLGFPVLSDDVVPVVDSGDAMMAYPSHPRLSLWADSAETLFGSPGVLPVHSVAYDKHYLDIVDAGYRFQPTPLPIDMIYVLGQRSSRRDAPGSQSLAPRAALLALVRNTYANYLLDVTMREHEFDVLSRLVGRVPIRELTLGDDLERISSNCRALAGASSKGPAEAGHYARGVGLQGMPL
jgi:hypothetical protein